MIDTAMSSWRDSDVFWGQSPSDDPTGPLHYPLLAVCTILVTIAPSTWFLSPDQGYLLSGAALLGISLYAIMFTDIRLRINPVFVLLFGGYWGWLVAHYWLHDPHAKLLHMILCTPVAGFATIIVLPQFVNGRRHTFVMGLTLSSVGLAAIGVWMLWAVETTTLGFPGPVGREVMGLYAIKTTSVFSFHNPYGFFMMIGSLVALYTVLVRGGVVWVAAFAVCLLGLVMSEGDAAFVGFGVGAIIVLSGRDQRLSFMGLGFGLVALYGVIRVGHIPRVMETTLLGRINRWTQSLEHVASNPTRGIGFEDVGSQVGRGASEQVFSELFPPLSADTGLSSGPHSSYVYPFLSTGIIGGLLYCSSLVYALGCGIRNRWTAWTAFVVGTSSSIYVYMIFESHFLGGVGVSSVIFGLFVGLMIYADPEQPVSEQ